MTIPDRPLTVQEAADYLKVSVFTMREYLRFGKIKAYKMGDNHRTKHNRYRWRIFQEDLDAFLKGEVNAD